MFPSHDQSLEKILDTHLKEAEVLIVDECHEFSKGTHFLAAAKSFPKAQFRIGFTATPPTEKIPLYNIEGALGAVNQFVTTKDLIDDGKLTKPIIKFYQSSKCEGGCVCEDLSYFDIYGKFIVFNKKRNNIIKDIISDIFANNKKAKVVILVQSTKHGHILKDLIPSSVFIEGETDLSDRYKTIQNFIKSKKNTVLIGSKILQTGINIEEITHFVSASRS